MKKLLGVVLMITLIVAISPIKSFANNTITLDFISSKQAGDSVAVTGNTTFDEITVKVLTPNKTILYVNTLGGGRFTDAFNLPDDAVTGTYTIIAGRGDVIKTKTFDVTEKSGGTDNTVTLSSISSKYAGDSIAVTGNTTFEEITVKILTPNKTILYVNALKGGNFTDKFKLPTDVMMGTYTVIAGKGDIVATKTFQVMRKNSGNDEDDEDDEANEDDEDTDDTTEEPENANKPNFGKSKEGKVKVTVKPVLEKSSKTVVSVISHSTMKEALERAKKTAEHKNEIVFDIPKVEGFKNYELQLPAKALSSEKEELRIVMNTPFGTINAPGNMFDEDALRGAKDMSITIAEADRTQIDEDILEQIGDRPIIELHTKINGKSVNWHNENASIIVSIDYTPTKEELEDVEHIVVWYLDDNGNVIPVPNGKYDSTTGKVVFKLNHFSKYSIAFVKKTFNDIKPYQWAKKQIEVLASKGVINGTSETTYSPSKNITRADFITLLVRALEFNTDFKDNFDDVKEGDYYYKHLGIAKALGITTGVGNNKFNPKDSISRQDMMVLVARALKIAGKSSVRGTAEDLKAFNDTSMISNYAVEGVATLIKKGVIQGSNNNINPKGTATRAETAVIIYRILNN